MLIWFDLILISAILIAWYILRKYICKSNGFGVDNKGIVELELQIGHFDKLEYKIKSKELF